MKAEADMVMWAMIASNLLWGLLMAYIFVQWANISTWLPGLKQVLRLDFLLVQHMILVFFAMTNMYTLNSMLIDIVVNTLFVGIMG